MRRLTPALTLVAASATALPAFAHEGDHEHMGFSQAVQHLVSEPDHQMMFAGLVVLLVAGGWTWARSRAPK